MPSNNFANSHPDSWAEVPSPPHSTESELFCSYWSPDLLGLLPLWIKGPIAHLFSSAVLIYPLLQRSPTFLVLWTGWERIGRGSVQEVIKHTSGVGRTPTTSVTQFQMGHGRVLGHSPGFGDPLLYCLCSDLCQMILPVYQSQLARGLISFFCPILAG